MHTNVRVYSPFLVSEIKKEVERVVKLLQEVQEGEYLSVTLDRRVQRDQLLEIARQVRSRGFDVSILKRPDPYIDGRFEFVQQAQCYVLNYRSSVQVFDLLYVTRSPEVEEMFYQKKFLNSGTGLKRNTTRKKGNPERSKKRRKWG